MIRKRAGRTFPRRHDRPHPTRSPSAVAGGGLACLAILLLLIPVVGCTRSETEGVGLSAAAARGKEIFHLGRDAEGEAVEAVFPGGGTLSGKNAACTGCHGSDGRGRREGGFRTADLSPHLLFSPSRLRPAHDEASLEAAITEGKGPDGRRLDPGMPRYLLGKDQRSDLIAYLRERERDLDPGVEEGVIAIGIALPDRLEDAAAGRAIRAVVEAVFSEANEGGGLYRRKVELRRVAQADAGGEGVLAWVASEADVWPAQVPVIGPLSFATKEPDPLGQVFHLTPGFEGQGRLAAMHGGGGSLALVRGSGEEAEAWEQGIRGEVERRGLSLREGGDAEIILFAGARGERPQGGGRLVVPASLSGIPSSTVVLPFRPYHEAFSVFLTRHGIRRTHPILQAQAYAAARLLIEGLRSAGATPTRASLVAGLESIRNLDTGVVPPLTYAPNRRIGADGAWIVELDGQANVATAVWKALPPK